MVYKAPPRRATSRERAWVGRPEVREFQFDGDRLTLRTGPLKRGRHTMVAQLIWERVR